MGPILKTFVSAFFGASLLLPVAKVTQEANADPQALDSKLEGEKKPGVQEKLIPPLKELQVHKVTLSKAGEKWIEEQKDVFAKTKRNESGGLIDGSTFLLESNRKLLDGLAGEKGGIGVVQFEFKKLKDKENGYQYALDVDYNLGEKERWYLSASPYYTDQYPEDVPPSSVSIAIWKGTKGGGVDKLTQHELQYERIVTKSGSVNYEYLLRMIDEAKESRESEIEDKAKIKSFDLSKTEPIGYIGLADQNLNCDPFLCGVVEDVGFFPELMSKAGYTFVTNKKGRNTISVMSSPKKIVEEEVEAFRKAGVKNIYLKLSSHGNETGTYFHDGKKYNIFTPRDLVDILNRFQDCKFTITIDACNNGGLSDAVKRYKDPSGNTGRIYLFIQSKISGFTQEGRLKDTIGHADIRFLQLPSGLFSVPVLYKAQIAPKPFSSYYNVFFYNHILNGEPFGRAHLKADEDTKKLVPCDAGAIKSTPRGGIITSMLNQDTLQISQAS